MAAKYAYVCRQIIVLLLFLLPGSLAFSQTTLSLASGSTVQGGAVSLNLSLSTTVLPAGLEWTISYSPGDVASLSVAAGPALTASGKTLTCNAATGSTTCLAVGMNNQTMASGIAAVVTATLAPTCSSSVPLSVVNTYGALLDGTATTSAGIGGAITVSAPANPSPSITALAPSTATAGGLAFTLAVSGSGFINGSTVKWNGSARTTTFVSATQLQAAILATDIASAGTVQVTVSNPAPGGGTCSNSAFNINNPSPAITALSPSAATASGAAFTLAVTGSGFINGSTVKWNGSARTTTFVSATQLQAAILATDIASAGTEPVTVTNPAPGGGTSASVAFVTAASTGPAAAYGFNEGTGTTTADSSGNGNTGQIQGATWTTSGKYGDALSFNGTSGYVNLGNPSSLQTSGNMTWSAWVYITANTTAHIVTPKTIRNASVAPVSTVPDAEIVARFNGTAGWELKTTSKTGVRTFAIAIYNGTGQTLRYSKTVPALNTWYYVAGVYNAASTALDIYVNGNLDDGTLTGNVPKSQTLVNVNTTIGKSYAGQYFNGTIDELRIYTRALAQADLRNDMNTPIVSPLSPHIVTGATTPAIAAHPANRAATVPTPTTTPRAGTVTVSALTCSPRAVNAGAQATCELRNTVSPAPQKFQVTSSSAQVRVPAVVSSRPSQSSLTFQASVDAAASQQTAVVTAALGDSSAQDTILVMPAAHPVLRAPEKQIARLGAPLAFLVTAVDPADLPLQLSATGMPAGASFDPALGRFEWTPGASQAGIYRVVFSAANSARQSASAEVAIEVDAGIPVLTPSQHLACSPGDIADLTGKWLAAPGAILSDPSGKSTDLGGTKVNVNGQYAPVLSSSATLVKFLCPNLDAGTPISAAVETAAATSNRLTAVIEKATPRILSTEGSAANQGLVSFVDSTDIAMARNFRVSAHPAQPGDRVLIWVTGLGAAAGAIPAVSVKLGDVYADVDAVQAVPGYAGLYTIRTRIPQSPPTGDAVPVQLDVATPDGHWFGSNEVTLAVEPASQ